MPHVFSRTLTLALGVIALPLAAAAQAPELPQSSPAAQVAQTVGLTDITVTYSSPAVRGRTIWGALVPYGEVWRTGANKATEVRFSQDVTIGGQEVPAGAYAMFTVPTQGAWTVILNRETELWGAGDYDPKQDQVRVEVTPKKAHFRERMTFLFSDTTAGSTRLDLEWAGLRVSVPVQAHTAEQVAKNIADAVQSAWRPHERAARYLLDAGGDLTVALGYIDASLAIQENWRNRWVKAQILDRMGERSDAVAEARRALELGDDSGAYAFYSKQMKAFLEKKR